MLSYSTDTVSEFWDSDDHRIFSLRMNTNGKLTLVSSNATNSKLYGISENCIGKELHEIMEKEHAERWYSRFFEWEKSGLVKYLVYFDDPDIGWDTSVEIKNNTVFGIGKKVNSRELSTISINKHEFFNHYFLTEDRFVNITLSYTEPDSFLIESIDSNFNIGWDHLIGKDISYLNCFCSNILDKQAYKSCLMNNQPIHFLEKCLTPDELMHFDVNLYPSLSTSKIKAYAKLIDEALYDSMQKDLVQLSEQSFSETQCFAICEINYNDPNNPYIIGSNKYFNRLLDCTDIALSSLIKNKAFQKCLKTGGKEVGDFFIQNGISESKHFTLTVSHLNEYGNSFLISLLAEEKEVVAIDFGFPNLTKREKEILTYVADGLTNRYIANKLNITEGTVKKTIYNSYKKLGICSRIELIKSLNT